MRGLTALLLALICLAFSAPAAAAEKRLKGELESFEGKALSPYSRDYDNSIKGPRKLDKKAYRLKIGGLVDKELALTYDKVLALPARRRLVLMPCVEGWSETLVYDGVRLMDLLGMAHPKAGADRVVFFSADGYSTALTLSYLKKIDAVLGYAINGITLNEERGWPFQLVAPGKLGYKWAKWIIRIELTDKPFLGFWEKRGYSDKADAKGRENP